MFYEYDPSQTFSRSTSYLSKTPSVLVEAGFFYTGKPNNRAIIFVLVCCKVSEEKSFQNTVFKIKKSYTFVAILYRGKHFKKNFSNYCITLLIERAKLYFSADFKVYLPVILLSIIYWPNWKNSFCIELTQMSEKSIIFHRIALCLPECKCIS